MEQGVNATDIDEGAARSSSSSTARRSTTTSSSATSSLMMRQRISWPINFSISGASLAPEREAGMNARTPTSTLSPPFTTAATTPAMAALSANALSSEDQSLGRSTFSFDNS
jgi:hypothetical protein